MALRPRKQEFQKQSWQFFAELNGILAPVVIEAQLIQQYVDRKVLQSRTLLNIFGLVNKNMNTYTSLCVKEESRFHARGE